MTEHERPWLDLDTAAMQAAAFELRAEFYAEARDNALAEADENIRWMEHYRQKAAELQQVVDEERAIRKAKMEAVRERWEGVSISLPAETAGLTLHEMANLIAQGVDQFAREHMPPEDTSE